VIAGSDRYERERQRLKLLEPEPVVEEVRKKKTKEKKVRDPALQGKRFTEVFLERIKNWFEEEND